MQVCLGRCAYDESLREQVWRARELEGLGETLLQLSLQVQVRGNSNHIVQVNGRVYLIRILNFQLLVLAYCPGDHGGGVGHEFFPNLAEDPTLESKQVSDM